MCGDQRTIVEPVLSITFSFFLWFVCLLKQGPGCPGTHSVYQAGLNLTEIYWPLPP